MLRGGLEGDEICVVGTAGLVLVEAPTVGRLVSRVHYVAVLAQVVENVPVGTVGLDVAVPFPRGELTGCCVPVGVLDHGVPDHAVDVAGVGPAVLMPEHAQRPLPIAAKDLAPIADLVHQKLDSDINFDMRNA